MCQRRGGSEIVSIEGIAAAEEMAHALDGTVAAKLALEVFDFGVVAQARNKEGFERVANDVRVLVGLD